MRFKFLAAIFVLSLFLPYSVVASDDVSSSSTGLIKRTTVKQEIKDERAELRDQFKTKIAETKAEFASRAAEFKAKIQTIKDERKKKIVVDISERISTRNGIWVTHWNNVLERLSKLLDKIETRVSEAYSRGKDVSSVTSAITSARSAIIASQTAVNNQAGKTYSITITTEGGLGVSVRSTIDQFHGDVRSVISSIVKAREAVSDTLRALAHVLGEGLSS